jgi:hypothetical protein
MSGHEYVNGPINVIRLEGKVGSVKKIIWVFLNWPEPSTAQTKCDDIRAVDISTYLVREFDQLKKSKPDTVYDFMYNRGPLVPDFEAKTRGTYQNQVAEIFTKSFEIDLDENRVKKSTSIPNVRFHYVNTTDYVLMKSPSILNQIEHIVYHIWNNRSYYLNDMINLHNGVKIIGDEVMQIYHLFFEEKKLDNPKIEKSFYSAGINQKFNISMEDSHKLIQKLIYKLKNTYDNKSVGTIMNKIIDTEFKDMLRAYFSEEKNTLETIISEIEFLKKLDGYDLNEILQPQDDGYFYGLNNIRMDENILFFKKMVRDLEKYSYDFIASFLSNANLVRRFLDKNYISHTVTYLFAYRGISLIRLLVKYFGFEITHWSYLKNNDLDTCNKMIIESKNQFDLNIIFLPVSLAQCSDLGSFPKEFN